MASYVAGAEDTCGSECGELLPDLRDEAKTAQGQFLLYLRASVLRSENTSDQKSPSGKIAVVVELNINSDMPKFLAEPSSHGNGRSGTSKKFWERLDGRSY